MAQRSREKKSKTYRLALIDDKTHRHLVSFHFTKTTFFIALVTLITVICAAIYSVIAYTPIRTFIPG